MDYKAILKAQLNNSIEFQPKKTGVDQVFIPIFHEDGDMYDVFIEKTDNAEKPFRICDYGLTLMHLSYQFDVDTAKKNDVFESIVTRNLGQIDDGNIYIDTTSDNLYQSLMQYYQIISKVSNMSILKNETIKSLFYDYLFDYIDSSLGKYNPTPHFSPIQDYSTDCKFDIPEKKPIFLFGVKDSLKARDAISCCMMFRNEKIPFESLIIYEDIDSPSLQKIDRRRLTNIADKQFSSLDDFEEQAHSYFESKCG